MPGTGSLSSVSITISTPCGPVSGQWRPSTVTCAAAILIPGAFGSSVEPFALFDELAPRLQRAGASALRLDQCSQNPDEQLICLLSALAALRRQGVERMTLIGWHSGATLALAAASACESVTGVAALAPDASAADFIADVAPRRLLLLHGADDHITPSALSRLLYARASDPKELVIYPGERHDFSIYHEETLDKLTTWTRSLLRNPFKPHTARHSGAFAALDQASQGSDSIYATRATSFLG